MSRPSLSSTSSPTHLFDWDRLRGRVGEVSESGFCGVLSAVAGLLLQVQSRGEASAWVATGTSVFFPPDLVSRGVDTEAVSLVLAPNGVAGLQAVDTLLRSGAFGLVIVDWAGGVIGESWMARLVKIAQSRQSAALFLTQKGPDQPSLASQVSLRGAVFREPDGQTMWKILKDKHFPLPPPQKERFHGPLGLY